MIEIAHLPKYNRAIPLALLLVCLGFGLLFMSGGVSAQGTAPIPAAYYGSVTVDGEPAPAGVEVTAELAGTTYGPITTNEDGEFGGPTPADQKLVVDPSEIPDNTEVVFFVEGQEVDTTVSWESGNNEQIELSVAELPGIDDGSDDGDDSSEDSSGSTGGQTGGGGGQSTVDEDVESGTQATDSSVEQARSELAQTTPDVETSVELADADPDRPGLTVNTDQSGAVRQITFGNERATGTVAIREYRPESVSESVSQAMSESVVANEEGDDPGDAQTEASVVSIVDISPSDEQTINSAATIRIAIDKRKLTNPNNTIILHERENGWEQLYITQRDTTGEEVMLEANVESFSLFTVAEITTSGRSTTDGADASSGGTDAADGGTSDGLNGFSFPVLFAVFLLVSLFVHRRINNE